MAIFENPCDRKDVGYGMVSVNRFGWILLNLGRVRSWARSSERESSQAESDGVVRPAAGGEDTARLIVLDGSERPNPTIPEAGQEGQRP
jgi:hypothetical protein